MDRTEFDRRLSLCASPRDLSVLADEILEELTDGADAAEVRRQMENLLDAGLDPSVPVKEGEGEPLFLNHLVYMGCDAALDIAGMIFDRCGVPEDFFRDVQFRIDYHYYNDPCAVRLYLLAASYLWEREETYITMSETLYEEMFDPLCVYTSPEEGFRKCSLTPAIFRDIGKFDFMVEMLPQQAHRGNRVIRIFDRESRIEVAQYR